MLPVRVKNLGLKPYLEVWQSMQDFTESRTQKTEDEIWLVEHSPVFTQGLAGKAEHILAPGEIPVVQIDRGGQVTYHAPGQAVMYLLLDIKRANVGVRNLVTAMENSVIELLRTFGIESVARPDAPGVYVAGNKIASLGLKIRRGCTYHGAALNVNLNLEPFSRINPCGLVGMKMVKLQDFGVNTSVADIAPKWAEIFIDQWRNLQTHN